MILDILIVDDEEDIRHLVAGILEDEGYTTRTARHAEEALAALSARRPHLVLLDIWMQGSKLDGLQLLEILKRNDENVPVVMISGHGNIETAVTAIKMGAYDFIEKPFKADRLSLVVQRALETSRLKRELNALRTKARAEQRLIGSSAAITHLRRMIERVGPVNARVMIHGASGSGKELTARRIHAASPRAQGPFVVISAATSHTLEEDLFGLAEGQDHPRRIGALEEAHGGTLYFDEITDLPLRIQAQLLRVLVDPSFKRVGGTENVQVDVRVITSTSRDLEQAIADGQFREDLFHRLSVFAIRQPSLAERRDDIPDLVEDFLDHLAADMGVARPTIHENAMAIFQAHDWPGNLRQLRNNIERLMILVAGQPEGEITADMLPPEIGALIPTVPGKMGGETLLTLPLREAREMFEREYLVAQLNRFGGNISRTAEFIGMERSALHRKLKLLGVD